VDSAGRCISAIRFSNRIRRIDNDEARTNNRIVGTGDASIVPTVGDGGDALLASLNRPRGLALDSNGLLYIADTGHAAVRVVDLADAGSHGSNDASPR